MTRTFPMQYAINSYLVPLPTPVIPGAVFVLEKVEGLAAGTGPSYLQFFDLAATSSLVSGTTVPFRSMLLQPAAGASNGFLWQYINSNLDLPILKNGLVIAISSTDNLFTTYSSTMNLVVSMSDWEMEFVGDQNVQGLTTIGDTTSAVSSLSVWTNATAIAGGFKQKLMFVYSINAVLTATQALYMLLFATDASPTAGTQAIQSWLIPPKVGSVNGKFVLNLGWNSGLSPVQYIPTDATAGIQEAGTEKTGCFLQVSSTPGIYTAPGQTVTIQAQYA